MKHGTSNDGNCPSTGRFPKQTMRKLSIAILFAALAGSLTVCAENAVNNHTPAPAAEPFIVDSTPVDRTNSHQFTSYAPMLAKVTPAVVTVATSSVVRAIRGGGDPMEEMLRRMYGLPVPEDNTQPGNPADSSGQKRVPNGMGSGVIVSSDGYILTNNHVVCDARGEAADEITVTMPDGREFPAKLVGRDPQTDVALIRIEAKDLPVIPFANSDNLMVGDIVFAVGNPMGLSQSVTMGIVSAVGRSRLGILGERGYEDFIQTDAPINPGNSGGALVDAEGRLVGINTAILSRTGGSIGIGFAIPASLARNTATSLMNGGKVERGYLGVTIRSLDTTLAESFGVAAGHGSLIEGIAPDSPADKAGMKRGDVITAIDGKPVVSESDLRLYVAQKKPGTTIKLTYFRNGKSADADVTLASLSADSIASDGGLLLPGVKVQNVTDEIAKKYGLDSNSGIVVTEVSADSPFGNLMAVGMQIVEINDTPVNNVAQALKLISKGTVNRLWVSFKGQNGYIGIRVPKQ
jgi:serine protease Do